MAVNIPVGAADVLIDQLAVALAAYQSDHPTAQIDLYRYDPVSIRVRVIDPAFVGQGRPDRHDAVWRYLEAAPEEAQSEISSLVLIAPGEQDRSVSNAIFENPNDEDLAGT